MRGTSRIYFELLASLVQSNPRCRASKEGRIERFTILYNFREENVEKIALVFQQREAFARRFKIPPSRRPFSYTWRYYARVRVVLLHNNSARARARSYDYPKRAKRWASVA